MLGRGCKYLVAGKVPLQGDQKIMKNKVSPRKKPEKILEVFGLFTIVGAGRLIFNAARPDKRLIITHGTTTSAGKPLEMHGRHGYSFFKTTKRHKQPDMRV